MKFYDSCIDWANASLGCELIDKQIIVDTPWSTVVKLNTSQGIFYLKKTPAKFAHEAEIIHTLRTKFNASVPYIVAKNSEMHCFIMQDAGTSLRTILKSHFEIEMLCNAVEQFTQMQLDVADHVEAFLKLDVPDWRTDKLVNVFSEMLSDTDLLMADGLSIDELDSLKNLLPNLLILFKKLTAYGIKDTIVQIDFNDNNIVVDKNTGKYTHVDLGEIVISHPFFSLENSLRQMHKHYNLTADDAQFMQVRESLFKNYKLTYADTAVEEAFSVAQILWYVNDALGQYRLIEGCDRDEIMAVQSGKLSRTLRLLIDALSLHCRCE